MLHLRVFNGEAGIKYELGGKSKNEADWPLGRLVPVVFPDSDAMLNTPALSFNENLKDGAMLARVGNVIRSSRCTYLQSHL